MMYYGVQNYNNNGINNLRRKDREATIVITPPKHVVGNGFSLQRTVVRLSSSTGMAPIELFDMNIQKFLRRGVLGRARPKSHIFIRLRNEFERTRGSPHLKKYLSYAQICPLFLAQSK